MTISIEIHYRWRILKIHSIKNFKLARLKVAAWFIKLAFWLEPLLEYNLSSGFTPCERAMNARKSSTQDAITPISVEYDQAVPNNAHIMSRRDFACGVATDGLMDDDGFGYPAKNVNGIVRMANIIIYPSRASELPADADFVVWFNR